MKTENLSHALLLYQSVLKHRRLLKNAEHVAHEAADKLNEQEYHQYVTAVIAANKKESDETNPT